MAVVPEVEEEEGESMEAAPAGLARIGVGGKGGATARNMDDFTRKRMGRVSRVKREIDFGGK